MKQVIQHFDIIQEEMKKSNELSSQELATIFLEPCNIGSFSTLCVAITQKIHVDLAQNKELLTFQRCKETKVNGTLFTNFE